MKPAIIAAACAAVALLASPAAAETLAIEWVRPARTDAATDIESIALQQFGGRDGPAAAIAIGDALRDSFVDGRPWLRVVPAGTGGDVDATLQGTVETLARSGDRYEKTVKTCVERDAKDKCIRKADRKIKCFADVVTLRPSLRLVDYDGRLLYADDAPVERTVRHCADERTPEPQPIVDSMVAELAGRTRDALVPARIREDVRVMEGRKGLDKETGKAFRDAVRLTKSDEAAACEAWSALEPAAPDQSSLVFNLALCAEQARDYERARAGYDRAYDMSDARAYAEAGLRRISDTLLGEAQLARQRGD